MQLKKKASKYLTNELIEEERETYLETTGLRVQQTPREEGEKPGPIWATA